MHENSEKFYAYRISSLAQKCFKSWYKARKLVVAQKLMESRCRKHLLNKVIFEWFNLMIKAQKEQKMIGDLDKRAYNFFIGTVKAKTFTALHQNVVLRRKVKRSINNYQSSLVKMMFSAWCVVYDESQANERKH